MSGQKTCDACGAAHEGFSSCRELSHQLAFYTLTRRDPEFVHQHAVDAYAAQHASQDPAPMRTAFALAGLYLFAEKGWTGKRVQEAHVRLARTGRDWPVFIPPDRSRSALNVADAVRAPEGEPRDGAIRDWARAVWETWKPCAPRIAAMLRERQLLG